MVKDETGLRRKVSDSKFAGVNVHLAFSHHYHYLLPALAPTTLLIVSFLPLILHTAFLLLFITLSSQSSKESGKQFII